MGKVAGIDQSVNHTGVCILDENATLVKAALIEPPRKLKDEKRLVFVRDRLDEIFDSYSDLLAVAMEGYSFGSLNRPFLLGEIGGIVKIRTADSGAELYTAAPKQRAKFATGNGSSGKTEVIRAIENKWKEKFSDDNLADGYVLARIAYSIIFKPSLKRYEREIVRALSKKNLPRSNKRVIKRPSLSV